MGVWWATGSGTLNQLNIQARKNGAGNTISQSPFNTVVGQSMFFTKTFYLNGSTDYVDFTAYNASGAALDIQSGAGTWFTATLVAYGAGQKGQKGDTGATGATGNTGASVAVSNATFTDANNTIVFTNSNLSTFYVTGVKGQKGVTGNTGSTGSTGSKGDKGDTGSTGSTGAKGDKGTDYSQVNEIKIGYGAGTVSQGANAIAIGGNAGQIQGDQSISIGQEAGLSQQGSRAIALGANSGYYLQGARAIAIGSNAGAWQQGTDAIAIGANTGVTNQPNNSIVINASGSEVNATSTGLFVAPIRNSNTAYTLYYNTTTKEVTYADAPAGGSANGGGGGGGGGGGSLSTGQQQTQFSTGFEVYFSSNTAPVALPDYGGDYLIYAQGPYQHPTGPAAWVTTPGVTQLTITNSAPPHYISTSASSGNVNWISSTSFGNFNYQAWSVPSSTKSATTVYVGGGPSIVTVNSSNGQMDVGNYPYSQYSVVFNTPDYCYFAIQIQAGYGANTFTPAANVAYAYFNSGSPYDYDTLLMRIPASIWATPTGGRVGSIDPYYAASTPYYYWSGKAIYFGS